MLSNDEVKKRLINLENIDYVDVKGDGYHYQLTIVYDAFLGKTKVSRQQWVYAQLQDFIASGSLHAVSMVTLTKNEWEKHHG